MGRDPESAVVRNVASARRRAAAVSAGLVLVYPQADRSTAARLSRIEDPDGIERGRWRRRARSS